MNTYIEWRLYWPEDGETSPTTRDEPTIRALHEQCEKDPDEAGAVIQSRRITTTEWENN